MKEIVVGIVGCGRIANHAHLPALSKMEGVRIKYACDLIKEKAEAAKRDYPKVEQVITDYHVILNDPEVDAVYVLTPNSGHYYITMDALKAGKHVMCEKPVTVNYALSKEMAEEANKQGKILNIGVCNRYQRSVEILEQMNREGKFGDIYHVYCCFRSGRSIPGLGGDFTTKKVAGGGVLIDWGIHYFDLILYILGGAKLKSVSCDTYSKMATDMKAYRYKNMWAENTKNVETGTMDVDDMVTGYIRTDKGTISFNGAWAQNIFIDESYVDFMGDKAGARLDYCGQFTYFDGATLESKKSSHEIPNMYACEDRAFLECIKTGKKDKNNIENILESMKLLNALYDSAKLHKEIVF